jgi:seryl-tRNA synthetase
LHNSNAERLAAEGAAASLRQALAVVQQQVATAATAEAAVTAASEESSSLRIALADSEARVAEQQAQLQSLTAALDAAHTAAPQLKEEHAAALAQAASEAAAAAAAAAQTSSDQQQQLQLVLDEQAQQLASARAYVLQLEADAASRCVCLACIYS